MNSYLIADQLLQHALNMLACFLLFSFLVRACLRIFQIKNYRLRACLRLLPVARLTLEPLFWLLPTRINASLFSCSHPLQYFLFRQLPEATREELSLYGLKTVSSRLLLLLPVELIYVGIASVIALSLYLLGSLALQCRASITQIKSIRQRGVQSPRQIHSAKLRIRLQRQQTELLLSSEVSVPLAGWGNCIIVPQGLAEKLSQKEFETVVAHELEHHRWHDTFLRLLSHSTAALYWWVPMTNWLRAVEQEQELASDASVHQYDLDSFALATALQKTTQSTQETHYQCAAFTRGKSLLERLQAAINLHNVQKQNTKYAAAGTALLLGLALAVGFVIC